MPPSRDPIFIHAMFRTGSTYLFHVFRRATDSQGAKIFTAFQEPIHESVMTAANDPTSLEFYSGTGAIPAALRHPEIGSSYFAELIDIAAAWSPAADPSIVYDDYFGGSEKTIRFLRALSDAAPRRPVICDCRTSLRIGRIKKRLGGTHAYLWRNPWDQWWSLKATDYFEVAFQVIAANPEAAEPIRRFVDETKMPLPPSGSIFEQFRFFYERRQTAAESYQLFFLLWTLALDSANSRADFDINIDRLSEDPAYRTTIEEKLESAGVTGVDFADANSPRSKFGSEDASFFEPLEFRARAILMESGWDAERLRTIASIRSAHSPKTVVAGGEARLRDVLRRVETRDAELVRRLKQEAMQARADADHLYQIATGVSVAIEAAVAAVRAEASDNRVRLDAAFAAAIGERESALRQEMQADATARLTALRQDLEAAAATQLEAMRVDMQSAADARESALNEELQKATDYFRWSMDAAQESMRLKDERFAELETRSAIHVQDAEINLAALRSRIGDLEHGVKAQSEAIAGLSWEGVRLKEMNAELMGSIEKMRRSTSWRLTAPIRAAGWFAASLAKGPKGFVREASEKLLGLVRAHPGLKKPVLALASAFPPLKRKLIHFGQVRGGPVVDSAPPSAPLPPAIEIDTPAARENPFLASARWRLPASAQLIFDEVFAEKARRMQSGNR